MNAQSIKIGSEIRISGDVVVSVPDSIQLMTTYILREREEWFENEIDFFREHLLQSCIFWISVQINPRPMYRHDNLNPEFWNAMENVSL